MTVSEGDLSQDMSGEIANANLVIMGFTATGTGKTIMKLALVSAVIIGATFLEVLTKNSLLGVVLGLTWGHYIIDARMWKMSLPDSRAYVSSRLKFALTK